MKRAALSSLALILLVTVIITADTPLAIPRGCEAVQYYRVRLKLKTASGVASVELRDTGRLITARQITVSGDLRKHGVSLRGIWVGPKTSGTQVAIIADYAVKATEIATPLPCIYRGSGEGPATLQVYNVLAGGVELIRTYQFSWPESQRFEMDLSSVASSAPLSGTPPRIEPQKMIWAFYYPWYDIPWDTTILSDRPAGGYYDSDDPAIIARHVNQAKLAGVDGFLSSWWGPGSQTDENLAKLLDEGDKKNFKVMINFELLTTDEDGDVVPREKSEIVAWLKYAITEYGNHPAYMRVDGKPVFVMWASQAVPASTWREVLEILRSTGREAALIAEFNSPWPKLDTLDVFAGMHTYNVVNFVDSIEKVPTDLAGVYSRTRRVVHNFPLLMETPEPRIWAATVQPGYDDHLIPGRTAPILDRASGEFYRATFKAATESDPDWLFITSWNEWWEHTYIEPSRKYGQTYLEMTREMSDARKAASGH
ncbi:MAG: glycoside hydrolase family 99-like domain-containing protein [Acidobacteriota bacterium]